MAAYRLELSESKGRCAVASVRLRAGACVLRTSAVCAVSSSSCGWCFKPQVPLSRCSGCRQVRYCSRVCQQHDWPLHRRECVAWRSVPVDHASSTVLLVSRLAYRIFLASEVDEEEKNRVLKLRHHLKDHTETKRQQFSEMTRLVLLLLSRYKVEKKETVKSFEELQNLQEEEILKLFGRVNCNAFSLANDVTNEVVGIGLFPDGALFNHDCDPNCVVSFKGREMQVHVVKDVKMDEELTVSYVELLQSTKSRRKELKESYFFECECTRCQSAIQEGKKDDWYLDGLVCKDTNCDTSGGVVIVESGENSTARCKICGSERDIDEIDRYERELEVMRVTEAASEWEKLKREWEIVKNHLKLHPRNARVAHTARKMSNFLLDANSQHEALEFLLAELHAVDWLLTKTKLPSRGLLLFQIGKLSFELVNSPLCNLSATNQVEQIQRAVQYLQEALSVLDCAYGSESVAVQSARLMLDEIQRTAYQLS